MTSLAAPDIKLPSVELQAPEVDLKVPSAEVSLDGADLETSGLKGKFKMPKFDKPKFGVSPPRLEGPKVEVSVPSAEVDLPSVSLTATGESPTLGLKTDIPKIEGASLNLEEPSLKMPKVDIRAPKVDISFPAVDISLPKASIDVQAPEAALSLEGEAKAPEEEAAKTKDGKFKMPKLGMPSQQGGQGPPGRRCGRQPQGAPSDGALGKCRHRGDPARSRDAIFCF
ncbi:PREDICTED: protein AHNAK2-like [Apaloderma vittatum]|uniref:protein AHNAK2-like n=1 Tax=Apaloderma vittatum TaxID=57397 RepID=UPI00052125B4|nr:PREDICTED: protein AHNAK2-like [Apaloderma vittatum]